MNRTKVLAIASLLLSAFVLITLGGCGEPLGRSVSGLEIDEIESVAPDPGLNDGLDDGVDIKACLGRVVTESTRLNVRSSPEIANNVCGSLPSNSYVTLISIETINGFYQIQSDVCESAEKYVSSRFIQLSDDCEADGPGEEPDPDDPGDIEDFGSFIEENLEKVSVVRPILRNGPRARVEVFRIPSSGENMICGSKHIRSYRSEPFLGKDSLCAWTAVLQEFRERYCPNDEPHCRVMSGDHTFGERLPSSWPHSTHRRGWCIDVWPMRNPGCGEAEITWRQSCYNRPATRNLIELMVKHGADRGNQLFFNDPQMPYVRPLRNHDDHIHVCFKPANSVVASSCDATTVRGQLCPEFLNQLSRQWLP